MVGRQELRLTEDRTYLLRQFVADFLRALPIRLDEETAAQH